MRFYYLHLYGKLIFLGMKLFHFHILEICIICCIHYIALIYTFFHKISQKSYMLQGLSKLNKFKSHFGNGNWDIENVKYFPNAPHDWCSWLSSMVVSFWLCSSCHYAFFWFFFLKKIALCWSDPWALKLFFFMWVSITHLNNCTTEVYKIVKFIKTITIMTHKGTGGNHCFEQAPSFVRKNTNNPVPHPKSHAPRLDLL